MKIKKTLSVLAAVSLAAIPLAGCSNPAAPKNTDPYDVPQDYCRTYYEVFVRSFADGNGDGIGDLQGLIDNLDYLNDGDDSTTEDLGINGIWMMPINSSPSYHKYDVQDYFDIDDEYGTLDDFDRLVAECEKRGIWLQMDLVLNHTSNQHPWFKNALADARAGVAPEDSEWMQMYNFVYPDEIETGVGTYRDVTRSELKYLGNFDSSMPDLNLDNETVREEIKKIVDFWLERGIKSFRLDAVPWAYENSVVACTGQNTDFWTWFNDYCHEKGAEVATTQGWDNDGIGSYCYNVGEVLSYSRDIVTSYFETGMSNFNFSLAYNRESSFSGVINGTSGAAWLTNEMQTIQTAVREKDANAILSNFLSNHDLDRSAGYLAYNATKIKKAAAMYMLMPGNAYIYYGEEIGAAGSGADENKRLAFNWGDKKKASATDPVNANYTGAQTLGTWKTQNTDPDSILTYYRNVIKLRNRFPEIGRGTIEPYGINGSGKIELMSEILAANGATAVSALNTVNALNKTVAAYTLTWEGREVLIVHNIGNATVSLDASVFGDYGLVGSLKASGGDVTFSGGTLKMSAATVAVLKKG